MLARIMPPISARPMSLDQVATPISTLSSLASLTSKKDQTSAEAAESECSTEPSVEFWPW